ncbi:uncharacterized protein JCM15063_003769 [Sporobolomyces koalae]|uniref:uncharacterized protein n=1 Tax=Sporobolomyces koalae TaxID=500713 RepID=UPI0031791144
MSRTATPLGSRPQTPAQERLTASRPHSRPHSRSTTPSRLQRDYEQVASGWIKMPPNNRELVDPATQSRTNDLLSNPNTEPVNWGDVVSKEELERIKLLAEKLSK